MKKLFLILLFCHLNIWADDLIYKDSFLGEMYIHKMTIDNKNYNFIFDTGSDFSIIDSRLIKQLKASPNLEVDIMLTSSSGAQKNVKWFKLDNAFLGKEKIKIDGVIPIDLERISMMVGQKIDGIIGQDIIGQYIWAFDNLKQEASVYKSNKNELSNCIKYEKVNNRPAISLDYYNSSIQFSLDTGYTGEISLHKEVDNDLNFKRLGFNQEHIDLLGVKYQSSLAVVDNLIFDTKYKIKRIEADLLEHENYIGIKFFKRFDKFTIIPSENKICFNHFSLIDSPVTLRRILIASDLSSNKIVITENDDIYLNSFLLKNGDVIEEINGRKYTPVEIFLVRKMLSSDKKIDLKIRRNHQTLYRHIE